MLVELRNGEATNAQPADGPDVPRASERPWAAPTAAPVPSAPTSLPAPPRAVVEPPTSTGPLNLSRELGPVAPDAAGDVAGNTRLAPEPPADPDDHLFRPRRRTRYLSSAAVVLGALVVSGAIGYVWIASGAGRGREATPVLGTFVLSSQPPGAQVVVDGVPAGITPLALRLTPGSHAIVATAFNGTSERLTTTVAAGESTSRHLMLESIVPSAPDAADASGRNPTAPTSPPGKAVASAAAAVAPPSSGFVTFTAPFDVQVYEGGDLLGTSGERMRVRPGTHTFTLVNDELGFRRDETLVVGAGRSTRRVVEQSSAPLSINALPWAEVVIAGRSFGETPLANISLPIGTYQVTLRHPTLGEREVSVTVRLGRPNRLAVDLRR